MKLKSFASVASAFLSLVATTPAVAAWQQATSRHFIVYENASPAEVKALTERLERYDSALRRMWRLKDRPVTPSSRVTLFMVEDMDDLHRLLGKGSDNIGGIYFGRAGQSVSFMPRQVINDEYGVQRGILLHEYAHHIMYTGWGQQIFPGWFVEGFAEFHSTARFQADGSVIFGAEPRHRQYGVGNSALMPMQKLLSSRPSWGGRGDEQNAFYARAWLLTDYLVLSPNGPKRFAAYMDAVNNGDSLDKAAAVLGDARQLDQEITAWGMQKIWRTKSVPASDIEVGEIAVRPLDPAEAAILPLRLVSERAVGRDAAQKVVAGARQVAAQYPASAAVQDELAEAEYDAGNFTESAAAADRAAALDPKSVHALLYRGNATIAQLLKTKAADPAGWAAARRAFLAANKIDSEDPRPLRSYYESFGEAGQPATANAQAGLLYAQALAPFDVGLRMEAGVVLLNQDKKDAARTMLQPVAFNPHAPELATRVGEALAKLDSDGAAAALAVLRRQSSGDAKTTD